MISHVFVVFVALRDGGYCVSFSLIVFSLVLDMCHICCHSYSHIHTVCVVKIIATLLSAHCFTPSFCLGVCRLAMRGPSRMCVLCALPMSFLCCFY